MFFWQQTTPHHIIFLKQGGIALYGRQRRLELMGDIFHKICAEDFRSGQFLCHQIKVMGHLPQLFDSDIFVKGHVEIAFGYFLCCIAHGNNRREGMPAGIIGDDGTHKNTDNHYNGKYNPPVLPD